MICCLNPDCQNPPHAEGTNFCTNCGTRMVLLKKRYRPLKSLGGDRLGKTYLAEDIAKDRECVIQQLALEFWQVEERHLPKERFEQQARRRQEGERDKIPKVLAYFEERESLYLVQDYVQGQNLREELKQQGIFSETQVREIWRYLLKILKVAHDRHIVHRDIKPENIIRAHPSTPLREGELAAADSLSGEELSSPTILPEKKPREWVLVGFDLGKPTVSNFSSLFSPTSNPASQKPSSPIPNPLFTPEPAKTAFGYRAMELQKGKATPASDLYSLGCVGFYLLTGVDPLELWRMEGYAWTSRWRSHLEQPASQELVGILDKLLQPKVALRYQSVEEVLADLDIEPGSQKAQPTTGPVPESEEVLPGESALKEEATEELEDLLPEPVKAETIAKAAAPKTLSPETVSPETLSPPVPESEEVLPGESALKEEATEEPEDLWRSQLAFSETVSPETASPETPLPESLQVLPGESARKEEQTEEVLPGESARKEEATEEATEEPEDLWREPAKAQTIAKAAAPLAFSEAASPETLSPPLTESEEVLPGESALKEEATEEPEDLWRSPAKAEAIAKAAAPLAFSETVSPETLSPPLTESEEVLPGESARKEEATEEVLPGETALKQEATEEPEDLWREPAKAQTIAKAAAPETAAPETVSPEVGAPEALKAEPIAKAAPPETVSPETAAPETAAPETAAPETVSPEVGAPEALKAEPIAKAAPPETVSPETVSPETAAPETVSPETVSPEVGAPEALKAEPIAKAAPRQTLSPETVSPETAAPETVSPETVSSEAEKAEAIAKPIAEAEPIAEPKAVDLALFPVDVSEGRVSEESPPEIAPSKSELEEDIAERKVQRLAIRRRRKARFQKKLVAAIAVLVSGGLAVAAIGELNRRGGFAVFGKSKNVFYKKVAIANTLSAHTDAVNAVAITPDGKNLISASSDNTIGIWNLKTGKLEKTLTGHTYLLNCLATSADGKIIASGGFDKTIRIWNLDTGELMQTISRNSVGIDALAISPDGQTLAAGSSRHIKIWNAKTGRLHHKLIAHKSWIGALGISPDGQTLVSGSLDGKIKIWNLPAGKLEKTLSGTIEAINSLAISPDGETFAAGGVSGKVEIWHLPSGKLQKTLSAHSSAVNSLTTSADGKTLISGGRDSTIKIWNPKTGKLLLAIASQKNGVNSVAISPDGRILASGSGDKTIQIWQLP
ncbi:MAG: hypothetical protein F6J93_13900 [Oscillatoria sp. SIO1A7]|nr:hypothetical protein [Oscillatoria sp. SIO1A7]